MEQDEHQAYRWYLASAVHGFIYGQIAVGTMLAKGQGVKQDRPQAIEWLQKAVRSDDPTAQRLARLQLDQLQ